MVNQTEDPNDVSAHFVGVSFSEGYYKVLRVQPDMVHMYYDDPCDTDKDTKPISSEQGINEVLRSLNMEDYSPEIRTVDSQYSYDGGVIVLVTGSFDGNNERKKFSQTFFLASRASAEGKKLYFVVNDIFRFDNDDDCSPPTPVADELTAVVDESSIEVVAEEVKVVAEDVEVVAEDVEVVAEDVQVVAEDVEVVAEDVEVVAEDVEVVSEDVEVVSEDVKVVAEDVEVVAENGHRAKENGHAPENGVAETPVESVKTEEAPWKKSFASVVSALKLNAAPFQVRAHQLKPVEQHRARAPPAPKPEPVAPTSAPAVNGSVEKNAESAPAKPNAIFVANLPMSATVDELDKVFKQFGAIKRDGIQVRSSKQLGTCFGFVEYECASSMQSALEASPVVFGARKLSIEERRATNDKPKYSSGRGGGYRNDHFRGGRGNFNGNNRGHGRNDYSGRGRGNGNHAPRNGEALQKDKPAATTPESTVKA